MDPRGPSSLTSPTRSILDDSVTKINCIRKQRCEIERQALRHDYRRRTCMLWDQAQKFGCVFPNEGDPDDCRKYYQQFDKQKLPTYLVTYFDHLFLWREFWEQEVHLARQIRRLRLESCKRRCKGVVDRLCFCKGEAESWIGHSLRYFGGLPTAKGYTRAPI